MIGHLRGAVTALAPGEMLVDVAGVAYRVLVAPPLADRLDGAEAALWIHTSVREDAIQLFGFTERAELEVFERLIAVAGVGPRTALGILSVCRPAEVAAAVESGDTGLLQRAPGVGRKTAERIVLELKGRLAEPGGGSNVAADAESALVNLGYSQRDAHRAVESVCKQTDSSEVGEIIRLALQRLAR